jgi:cell division protein FtsN
MPTAGKDYKGRRSSMSKNEQPLPGYLWMLAGLAIGLFVAFITYLQKQPAEEITFTEAVVQELEKVKKNTPEKKKNDEKNTPSKEPKFDFYTILPELEVFIPEPEMRSEEKIKTKNKTTKRTTGKKYLLQAGSFRSHEDADQLKATLALLGVQSSIQSVNIKSESWHRVRIGPFDNTGQLHDTLSTLKNNKIHAMTMELKN